MKSRKVNLRFKLVAYVGISINDMVRVVNFKYYAIRIEKATYA